ncbi:hypothetical protein [Lichenicoccus sp.]|uniref:hypothetical protein n=1 Tax=Lichenicoccus sp. TaxID=2781899 RepID=UPI003D0C41C2
MAEADTISRPTEFWHTRHVCGHSVAWSDIDRALAMSAYPCPWWGGETGHTRVPKEENMGSDLAGNLFFIRDPSQVPGRIVLHHRADEYCCNPEA